MYRLILLFVLTGLTFGACKEKAVKPGLTGTISGTQNMQVLFEQLYFDNNRTTLGKTQADAEGKFHIEPTRPFEKGLYCLTIGAKQLFLVLDGSEKTFSLNGDIATFDAYGVTVEGSESIKCHVDILKKAIAKQAALNAEDVRMHLKESCNPLIKAVVAQQFVGRQAANFLPELKEANQELATFMPDSKYALDFDNWVSSAETQIAKQQAGEKIKVGQPAPEISLPGPDGKVRSLSSLKGQVVLLDFWASWCRPCRMANPHVVEVYSKYKDKGFTVFSVSLDKDTGKEAWIAAIAQDKLVWDNHVSDLKFWNSVPAAVYGVQGIPKTFLIDREGNIAAINPRDNLEEMVKQTL